MFKFINFWIIIINLFLPMILDIDFNIEIFNIKKI